jgi:hypothetical protein
MIFLRPQQRYSSKLKTKQVERCAHFSGCLAFVLLVIAAIMLFFGIVSRFSEQKTVFYILFALSLLSFFTMLGVTIFHVKKVKDNNKKERAYQLSQLPSVRFAVAQHHFENSVFQYDIQQQQLPIQNSMPLNSTTQTNAVSFDNTNNKRY